MPQLRRIDCVSARIRIHGAKPSKCQAGLVSGIRLAMHKLQIHWSSLYICVVVSIAGASARTRRFHSRLALNAAGSSSAASCTHTTITKLFRRRPQHKPSRRCRRRLSPVPVPDSAAAAAAQSSGWAGAACVCSTALRIRHVRSHAPHHSQEAIGLLHSHNDLARPWNQFLLGKTIIVIQ